LKNTIILYEKNLFHLFVELKSKIYYKYLLNTNVLLASVFSIKTTIENTLY